MDPQGAGGSECISKRRKCRHAAQWSRLQHRFCQRVWLLRVGTVVALRCLAGTGVASALCQPLGCTCTGGRQA